MYDHNILVAIADSTCRENDITGVMEPSFSTEEESFGEVQTIDLKPTGRKSGTSHANAPTLVLVEAEAGWVVVVTGSSPSFWVVRKGRTKRRKGCGMAGSKMFEASTSMEKHLLGT